MHLLTADLMVNFCSRLLHKPLLLLLLMLLMLISGRMYLAIDKFPSLERERERASSGAASQSAHSVKTPDYNHTAEIIFAFPSLQLHLKSEHLQGGKVPLLTGTVDAHWT